MRLTIDPRLENGLPAQAAVPLAAGACGDAAQLQVRTAAGAPCATQARSLLTWPDGSVKWALVLFDPGPPPGHAFEVQVQDPPAPAGPALAGAASGRVEVDTGAIRFSVPEALPEPVHERTEGVLTDLSWTGAAGPPQPLTAPRLDAGLVAVEADGRVYSSQKAGPGFVAVRGAAMDGAGVSLIEAGPLRCQVRVAGKLCRDNYESSLDYVVQLEAYRGASLVRLEVAWRHGADRQDSEARFVRDLRLRFPLAFAPQEVRFGIERGEYAEAQLPTSTYALTQEDADRYWLRRIDWDGDEVDLGHGSASGRRAPGWVQVVGGAGQQLSAHVPDFAGEYPDELAVTGPSLEIGLWPQAANAQLASRRILPPNPHPAGPHDRHRAHEYAAILAHPYQAFYSSEHQCLETVQGMQKTQEIYLEAAPLTGSEWAARIGAGRLRAPRAAVAPEDVDAAGVLGAPAGAGPRPRGGGLRVDDEAAEAALDRAIGWLVRHRDHFEVYGKFDFGDLRYMVMSPYMTHYRHKSLKEHPRMHYWNNNEEDPVHGLFVNGLRHGRTEALELARAMGRHLWDVDVRHYPYWGLHTHSGGHCFRSIADRATDHFWIEALVDYYLLTGDPDVREGVEGLARYAAEHLARIEYADTNLREVAIAVTQAVEYYRVLHDPGLLQAAEAMGRQILAEQKEEGYYPGRGHRAAAQSGEEGADWPHALFGTLALEALAALDEVRPRPEWRASAVRQLDWFLENGLLPARDGINARPRPDGRRPEAGQGYDPGYHDYKLVDFQLLKALGYAIGWRREDGEAGKAAAYQAAGDRILARLLRVQLGPEYGPAYEGNWNESEPIADPGEAAPGRSEPRDPVDPGRCPYQIRPLGVSAALRCLPCYLAARR
ncbi:MAG: hypothetical protein ABIL09_00200 [Gemmatimonadota bacterium]